MVGAGQAGASPNQYHLHGGGINVSYFPDGAGPIVEGQGPVRLTYQDSVRALTFRDDIRAVEVADIGTIVSVTIVPTIDIGSTTFSLLVPLVVLPEQAAVQVPVDTDGVTTVHRLFAVAVGHPQRASYTVHHLHGTASDGILPL